MQTDPFARLVAPDSHQLQTVPLDLEPLAVYDFGKLIQADPKQRQVPEHFDRRAARVQVRIHVIARRGGLGLVHLTVPS